MTPNVELRKLRWHCRRGMVELDVLLSRYLDRRGSEMDDSEIGLFRRLLECEDDRLWRWFTGIDQPQDKDLHALVVRIAQFPRD